MSGRFGRAAAVAVVLLAIVAGGGFVVWRRMATRLPAEADDPGGSTVSPELAEATLDRIEGLRAGEGRHRLELGSAELSSVMRYALPGIVPPGVTEPDVQLHDGSVSLAARVATRAFPDLPSFDKVLGMLPDTVPVGIRGRLQPYGKESLAFFVTDVDAATIPVPGRLIPQVLNALGRQNRKGLPANALHIPMPGGLDSIFVAGDSLVLVSDSK
jgi:hypothetical protein